MSVSRDFIDSYSPRSSGIMAPHRTRRGRSDRSPPDAGSTLRASCDAIANFRAASPWPAPDYSSLDPGETATDRAVCPDIVSFLFPHDPRFAQGVDILAQDWLLLPYPGRGIPPA